MYVGIFGTASAKILKDASTVLILQYLLFHVTNKCYCYCSVHEVHGIFSSYQLSEASTVLLNNKGRQLFFCGQQLFSSLMIEHSTVQC